MKATFEVLLTNASKFPVDSFDKDQGCVDWPRYKNELGYGHFRFKSNGEQYNVYAHRASYILFFKKMLSENIVLRHTCDNPSCINPYHLVEGTHEDNVRDKVEKDRQAKGEENGRAKLTEDDVRLIRASNLTETELAAKFNVSRRAINKIKLKTTWKHVV